MVILESDISDFVLTNGGKIQIPHNFYFSEFGEDDWFNDQFDELLFGDIDVMTRDDETIDQYANQNPTHFDPLDPLDSWDNTGFNVKYKPEDFEVSQDVLK